MDYEKKYKEALEKARIAYNKITPENTAVKKLLEESFPELAESEDERIRKEIVHYILYKAKGVSEEQEHAWIAYLEKQKENPKSADSISSDCVSDAKCEDRWHKVEDSLPDNGREVLAKDKLGNTLLARYDGEGWDVSVYDDEDYRCHNGISKWCEIPSDERKEQKKSLSERFRPDFPTVADFIESVDELEKDKAIEILENYLKWAVSESEEECPYYWKEIADAIRLGISAMKEKKPNIELIQKSWYMEGYHDRKFNNEPKWIIKTGEGGPRYEENPKYGQSLIEQRPTEEQLHNLNEAIK